MYMPEGGLGIVIEIGMDVPLENIDALLDEMDKMKTYGK
jgi:hypothetical protein